MATDHTPSGRRPHYHRGRRGMDRRSSDRRSQQASEPSPRLSGDQTDVEQIMRDIRARIAQRHGIELSNQQIQELAARRLEAILDPRNISPTLLDQLRKGAATPPDPLPRSADTEYSISDDSIYEGSAVVRFFRRLFNPLMKLLFNPAPLVAALQAQVRINRDAAARAAELERRQTEWNALHYQILQRLVTDVSRTSIDLQAFATRIEALAARVDFNDKRVRTLENTPVVSRSQRTQETAPVTGAAAETAPVAVAEVAPTVALAPAGGEGPRRRRRRRRGRRGSTATAEPLTTASGGTSLPESAGADIEEEEDDDSVESLESAESAAEERSTPPSMSSGSTEVSPPPWSPDPQPTEEPAPPAVVHPDPHGEVTAETSGQTVAVPEPTAAASASAPALPSGTPDTPSEP